MFVECYQGPRTSCPLVQLVRVDAVSHRHAGNRGAGLVARFDCTALEFERVGSPGRHRVRQKLSGHQQASA
jgi:hypothetical protein